MKYRKRPVVVDAFEMTREASSNPESWPAWLQEAFKKPMNEAGALHWIVDLREDGAGRVSDLLHINTLEGKHTVLFGDFIIKGVHGELYQCKPDIFWKTYEEDGA